MFSLCIFNMYNQNFSGNITWHQGVNFNLRHLYYTLKASRTWKHVYVLLDCYPDQQVAWTPDLASWLYYRFYWLFIFYRTRSIFLSSGHEAPIIRSTLFFMITDCFIMLFIDL